MPVLLYDGSCSFCAASVQFILRHERRHGLEFAALQSRLGSGVRARHPEISSVDSLVWVEPAIDGRAEQALVRSAAALRIAWYLGGPWRLAALGALVPAVLRDAAYDAVARHRHRLRRPEQCYVPPPDVKVRFLE